MTRRKTSKSTPATLAMSWHKIQKIMMDLAEELEELEGHGSISARGRWARRVHGHTHRGLESAYEFEIKAPLVVPAWVGEYLGEDHLQERLANDAESAIHQFVKQIMDSKHPDYQPWATGNWAIGGRLGGWLLLEHEGTPGQLRGRADSLGDFLHIGVRGKPVLNAVPRRDVAKIILEAEKERSMVLGLSTTIRARVKAYKARQEDDESWRKQLGLPREAVQHLKEATRRRSRKP